MPINLLKNLRKSSKRKTLPSHCPCCRAVVSEDNQQHLLTQIDTLFEIAPDVADFLYQNDKTIAYSAFSSSTLWACDHCIQTGSAISSNLNTQKFCLYQPYFTYFDQTVRCKTCQKDFVFSKEEQQYWYETLQFWVMSKAVDCKACRQQNRDKKHAIRTTQQAIQNLLVDFDPSNQTHIEEIICLYEQLGSTKKINQYKKMLFKLKQ